MAELSSRSQRFLRYLHRRVREWSVVAKCLVNRDRPLLAHIIPIRRCNLACTYCNEFDDFSPPVPLDTMKKRIDELAALGTCVVAMSGGEPLMHPDLDDIIRHIRSHGMMAGMITNGFLLTADRIRRLNDAGLEHLQISIDNVMPDDVSKKSLKTLDKKLQLLAAHAMFHVNINSVVGGGIHNPADALTVGQRAVSYGLTSTVGIIHDGDGQLQPLSKVESEIYLETKKLGRQSYGVFNKFQDDIAWGREHEWKCRSGARYLYICEDGLVHYCSQQRGYPGKPLAAYTVVDIRREYVTEKSCAPRCTVACVHYSSTVDFWRDPQTIKSRVAEQHELVQIK